MRTQLRTALVLAAAASLLAPLAASAQDGTLRFRRVRPSEAHLFVDGQARGHVARVGKIRLSPGSHQVELHAWGHKPFVASVHIAPGEKKTLEAILEPIGGSVSGPWGRIQIEGAPNGSAVFLNGRSPDFLVGHSDMFNHDWVWKQELLVPPGTHEVLIQRDGATVYSGSVTVAANQRVIIEAGRNTTRTTDWPRGSKLGSVPRFKTGIASATIAVNPVAVANFSANPAQINCGDSSRLTWSTTWADEVSIDGDKVSASGEKLVSPRATHDYKLAAAGPGGRTERSATVSVNTATTANISASPGEIRYRKIGDRVVEHGTTTLTWSTSNASNISIAPAPGSVPASGSRGVQPAPQQTAIGPVNETVTYTLTAANDCGGRETRTASVRLVGEIEGMPEVVLASVFFPTDYPDPRNPNLGLLRSQRQALTLLAQGLKKYLEYDRNARLVLEAHADERRSPDYNRALSQRRADLVKQFLADQGIPAGNIDVSAFGEERNLDRTTVKSLEEQNPAKGPRDRLAATRSNWLAHNRRVDIVLRPSGQQSKRYYPHAAADSKVLWQVPKPAKSTVEKNQ